MRATSIDDVSIGVRVHIYGILSRPKNKIIHYTGTGRYYAIIILLTITTDKQKKTKKKKERKERKVAARESGALAQILAGFCPNIGT